MHHYKRHRNERCRCAQQPVPGHPRAPRQEKPADHERREGQRDDYDSILSAIEKVRDVGGPEVSPEKQHKESTDVRLHREHAHQPRPEARPARSFSRHARNRTTPKRPAPPTTLSEISTLNSTVILREVKRGASRH